MASLPLRIGFFGGTFDPIHRGHLELASKVCETFDFDELWFIPAYCPPHKSATDITPAYHRFAMTVLATLDVARFRVSTLELLAPERPYTVNTMTTLRAQYGPEAHLFFLMGADSLLMLKQWHRYRELLDLCHLVVMSRPGYDFGGAVDDVASFGNRLVDVRNAHAIGKQIDCALSCGTRIFLMNLLALEISGTDIRTAVGSNQSIAAFVPPLVERYIQRYKLYQ